MRSSIAAATITAVHITRYVPFGAVDFILVDAALSTSTCVAPSQLLLLYISHVLLQKTYCSSLIFYPSSFSSFLSEILIDGSFRRSLGGKCSSGRHPLILGTRNSARTPNLVPGKGVADGKALHCVVKLSKV